MGGAESHLAVYNAPVSRIPVREEIDMSMNANATQRWQVYTIAEGILAGMFVVSIALLAPAPEVKEAFSFVKFMTALPVIIILTLWWALHVKRITQLDELQRTIELRSLAIACGVILWITTVWGVMSIWGGMPELPLVIVAPLAAVVYGIIRTVINLRYR